MDFNKLFETQAALEEVINKNHPVQDDEDRLSKKILALQAELGELANEWRGFKYWSNDQEPRKFEPSPDDLCKTCGGQGYKDKHLDIKQWKFCKDCDGIGVHYHNPLLEEYADCTHFILAIGLEMELECRYNSLIREENIVEDGEPTLHLFAEIFAFAAELFWGCYHEDYENQEGNYKAMLTNFVQLGKSLGFTWEQIEQAYYTKNKVNLKRQAAGY